MTTGPAAHAAFADPGQLGERLFRAVGAVLLSQRPRVSQCAWSSHCCASPADATAGCRADPGSSWGGRDAAIRDPAHPSKLRPAFDSGDHLHPSDAGYQAMADAIDLALFDPHR